jgi:hypothetical protein
MNACSGTLICAVASVSRAILISQKHITYSRGTHYTRERSIDRANYQDNEKFSLNSRSTSYRDEPEKTQANKNKTANASQLRLQPA